VIVVAGVGAFLLGHLVVPAAAAAPNTPRIVALLILAAIAEELFFRRLVFGALRPRGETVAIVGSAWLFAVVHVTVYGWYALPLDLAAGLLLSWQRSASGTWRAPAVTHVAANILGVL
jgi:membrane protease YdiL (CAAX protease family)